MAPVSGDAIERALELLEDAARQELAQHPRSHLLGARGETLELRLPLALEPTRGRGKGRGERAEELRSQLRDAVDAKLAEQAALTPGRVLDLRTGESGGEHCAPPDGRSIFVGYEPNGTPRFANFSQWLLDQGHPEQHRLYEQPPGLITEVISGRDLMAEVLPAFRPASSPVRVRGQVVAGWFRVPQADGMMGSLALTLQILSVRPKAAGKGARERWLLDLLATGPKGEPLDDVVARLRTIPWRPAVEWGQKALESFGHGRRAKGAELEKRVLGVLGGIARRLHQVQRGRQRRTGHAEERHRDGGRPTRMAFSDLEKAGPDRILVDRRRETLIVLGERGRAHVWSPGGKLVTSIRYTPESIERKKNAEIWRPASAAEVGDLRRAVAKRGS